MLLVELACLRWLSLIRAVGAKVGARAVRPGTVETAVGELCVVRTKIHAIGKTLGDLVFGERGAEHAIDHLLPNGRLVLENRVDVEWVVVGSRIEQASGIRIHVVERASERRHREDVTVRGAAFAL